MDRARAAPAKPWDAEAEAEWLVTLGVGEHAAAADDAAAAVGAKGPGPDGATGESLPSVVSVNETLVAEGLCRADGRKDVAPPELRERLAAAQERARVDRAGMWEYGDVDSDDEEPTLAKPGAWGRRR